LEVETVKKCTALLCQGHFHVKMYKVEMDVQALFCVAGAMDSAPCKRSAKSVGFAAVSQTMRGADLKRARKKKKKIAWQEVRALMS